MMGGITPEVEAQVKQRLQQHFRPEFLNRVDDIVLFAALSEENLVHIVELMVVSLQARLKLQGYTLDISDDAKAWLAKEGYDPVFGARPLKRFIQHEVETPLARYLIAGEAAVGDAISVSYEKTTGLHIGKPVVH